MTEVKLGMRTAYRDRGGGPRLRSNTFAAATPAADTKMDIASCSGSVEQLGLDIAALPVLHSKPGCR